MDYQNENELVIGDIIFTNLYEDEEAVRDEVSLNESPFLTSHNYTDLVAFARRIQTILLMEPGTNPGAIDMGVGIRNYVQELATEGTLNEIKHAIDNQIKKWIPNDIISSIDVKLNPRPHERNTLYILFEIQENNSGDISGSFFGVKLDASGSYREEIKSAILI